MAEYQNLEAANLLATELKQVAKMDTRAADDAAPDALEVLMDLIPVYLLLAFTFILSAIIGQSLKQNGITVNIYLLKTYFTTFAMLLGTHYTNF